MKQLSQRVSGKTSLHFNHVRDSLVSNITYAVIAILSIGQRWKKCTLQKHRTTRSRKDAVLSKLKCYDYKDLTTEKGYFNYLHGIRFGY